MKQVLQDLDDLAALSSGGPGVNRIAFSEQDVAARRWFALRCADLQLEFEVDRYGTCFGWSAGCAAREAVLLGSHLDSVPRAGRFDGTLGVAVGFEVARRLLDADPQAPVAVVAFACEESTRFGVGVIGSRLLVGLLDPEVALDELRDLSGKTLRDVLAAAELDNHATSRFDPVRIACFLEAHVDQGSTLAASDEVGIVDGIAGCVRTRITWTGEASHSGAHARLDRRDALLGAARFIVGANDHWGQLDRDAKQAAVTVGWLENGPNAPSTVSGRASVVVDLRAPEAAVLDSTNQELVALAREIGDSANLRVEIEELGRIEPVKMAPDLVEVLVQCAASCHAEFRVMPSLSGHDAEIIGLFAPTAMVFVANPAGVSHSPDEAVSKRSLGSAIDMLEAAALLVLGREAVPTATTEVAP